MKHSLNKGLLLAGLSVAVGASMSGAFATAAGADGGPWSDSYPDQSWERSCHHAAGYDSEGRRAGLKAIGLTDDQKLIRFDVNKPGNACKIGDVSLDDEVLVGIDYRVQNGKLYGVGDEGGIYVLSTRDASAKRVSQLTVDLDGEYFGVDFNPAADRLRIISDTGQNLRHDVNPGGATIEDGDLTYPPAADAALGVTGAAYTNNDLDPATNVTLFDLDTALDQIAVQSPANSGQLAVTGKLGVNAGIQAGFDIYSSIRDDRAVYNKGFAVLHVGDHSNLYKIDMLTSEADKQGTFRDYLVTDLALPLDQH